VKDHAAASLLYFVFPKFWREITLKGFPEDISTMRSSGTLSFELLVAACLLSAAFAITPEVDGHVVEVRAARPHAPDVDLPWVALRKCVESVAHSRHWRRKRPLLSEPSFPQMSAAGHLGQISRHRARREGLSPPHGRGPPRKENRPD